MAQGTPNPERRPVPPVAVNNDSEPATPRKKDKYIVDDLQQKLHAIFLKHKPNEGRDANNEKWNSLGLKNFSTFFSQILQFYTNNPKNVPKFFTLGRG